MRAQLLGLAVAVAALSTVPISPAAAQTLAGAGFASSGQSSDRSFVAGFGGGGRDGRDHRRRNHGDSVLIYDRDYQGDTAWRPSSFNDWWHDRPDRAFPRWMQSNQDCQKPWYAGSTLRC